MAPLLQDVMQSLEPHLKRYRPLARACPQLLLDLAALLSGLRAVIMLDHAPGVTPTQLQQALQPLQDMMPGIQGCILYLDGCCYIANAELLLERLTALTTADEPCSSTSRGQATRPTIITFSEGQPTLAQPEQCIVLQQQLGGLISALSQHVQAVDVPVASGGGGQASSSCRTMQQANRSTGRINNSCFGFVDLGQIQGLPTMPTLNGFLLGYPVVYWVRSLDEAAVASKQLSASTLRLYKVLAKCKACDKFGDGTGEGVLMAFTIPEALCSAAFESKGLQWVEQLDCTATSAEAGLLYSQWLDIRLSVEAVDSCSVSL